jgi:hypothetical protein
LSHLKEYVVSVVVLGRPAKITLARLHANMKKKPSLDGKSPIFGFRGEGYQVLNFDEETNKYEVTGGVDGQNRSL